jgi:hypothetical protein
MLIDHLFWSGRAYLAQALMCAGGSKTASINRLADGSAPRKLQMPVELTGKE